MLNCKIFTIYDPEVEISRGQVIIARTQSHNRVTMCEMKVTYNNEEQEYIVISEIINNVPILQLKRIK